MANLNIAIQIAAKDNASGVIGSIKNALAGLGDSAKGGFAGLQNVALFAGGAALAGVGALAGGMGAVGAAGLSMNKQMEDVSARLNAFTKDADKSAEILEMIRVRAAKTPFAFNEMADAAAGLLPAAKASGQELEFLISQAEILAASNPAEGLSGAAFALREAVSGDFTSIIERFNLPRQYINQLKEEGVPAMEIVSRAMQEVGFDADLVGNLAETAGGRWSTFLDTLQNLAATITQPIFDIFSGGLAVVNQWLSDNEPLLTSFAQTIATTLASGIQSASAILNGLIDIFIRGEEPLGDWSSWWEELAAVFGGPMADNIMSVVDVFYYFNENLKEGMGPLNAFIEAIWDIAPQPVLDALVSLRDTILPLITSFVSWQDVLVALGVVVASIVLPALWGIVTAAAPVIAVGAALVGAIALARNAWENDWGGIQGAVSNAWAQIGPLFEVLKAIINEFIGNLLPEFERIWRTLLGVWVSELKPALMELWASFQELFAELGLGTGDVSLLEIAVGALKMGLDGVVWIVRIISPLIRAWADGVVFASGQVRLFVDGLVSLKRGAEAIIAPLQRVADKIGEMISAATSMPDWLIPGSPTPFEVGLRGIGAAINAMPDLSLPMPGGALAQPAPALVGASAGGSSQAGPLIGSVVIYANDEAGGQRAAGSFLEEMRSRGLM